MNIQLPYQEVVKSTVRSDGSIHHTVYDKERNKRVSRDEKRDGTITNVHSTDQNKGGHITYKKGK